MRGVWTLQDCNPQNVQPILILTEEKCWFPVFVAIETEYLIDMWDRLASYYTTSCTPHQNDLRHRSEVVVVTGFFLTVDT